MKHGARFVAFSCKQPDHRCVTVPACPSCHQKRTLLTALHVADEVCSRVAHRQVVLTIPKRLRVHTRFDRQLLGKLSSCARVVPGMIAAIPTHGELLHWHPHIHMLITCGAFTPEGEFLELPVGKRGRVPIAGTARRVLRTIGTRPLFRTPLCCPECGGQMKVVSFIEPPQADVIEAILKHCGLWQSRTARAPPDVDELVLEPDASYADNSMCSADEADEFHELSYVDIDTFLESF